MEKFAGYLAAYRSGEEDREKDDDAESEGKRLPRVTQNEMLQLARRSANDGEHAALPVRSGTAFHRAASAIHGSDAGERAGRKRNRPPSTYAAIISTIVEREYVNKEQGRFTPTMLGEKVSVLLVKSFEDIFDLGFTARMEEELDEIEEGKLPWKQAVGEFYERFVKDLAHARATKWNRTSAEFPRTRFVPKCDQGHLLERISRNGFFMGCDRYPDCDYTRDLSPEVPARMAKAPHVETCPECGKEMVIKRGRFGPFLACSAYPDCKTTRRLVQGTRKARQPDKPLEEKCPDCGRRW